MMGCWSKQLQQRWTIGQSPQHCTIPHFNNLLLDQDNKLLLSMHTKLWQLYVHSIWTCRWLPYSKCHPMINKNVYWWSHCLKRWHYILKGYTLLSSSELWLSARYIMLVTCRYFYLQMFTKPTSTQQPNVNSPSAAHQQVDLSVELCQY